MELFIGLLNCFVSFVIGALVTVALQYYIFMKYVRSEPVIDAPKKPAAEKYCMPKVMLFIQNLFCWLVDPLVKYGTLHYVFIIDSEIKPYCITICN